MKRPLWILLGLLILGVVTQAQFFNLELEDEVTPKAKKTKGRAALPPINVNVSQIPNAKAGDELILDKIYKGILAELQENKMDEATAAFSKLDVITQQKIIYRMIKEHPLPGSR